MLETVFETVKLSGYGKYEAQVVAVKVLSYLKVSGGINFVIENRKRRMIRNDIFYVFGGGGKGIE